LQEQPLEDDDAIPLDTVVEAAEDATEDATEDAAVLPPPTPVSTELAVVAAPPMPPVDPLLEPTVIVAPEVVIAPEVVVMRPELDVAGEPPAPPAPIEHVRSVSVHVAWSETHCLFTHVEPGWQKTPAQNVSS
jgi:hypothetical protein